MRSAAATARDAPSTRSRGRTQHPIELLGDDWYTYGDWGIDPDDPATPGKKKAA